MPVMMLASLASSLAAQFGGEPAMHNIIETHRDEVHQLCRQFGVQRLDVFGSAAGAGFDPQRSDIDFVMTGGMVNPYFSESVNRTRQTVYARPLAEAA